MSDQESLREQIEKARVAVSHADLLAIIALLLIDVRGAVRNLKHGFRAP